MSKPELGSFGTHWNFDTPRSTLIFNLESRIYRIVEKNPKSEKSLM